MPVFLPTVPPPPHLPSLETARPNSPLPQRTPCEDNEEKCFYDDSLPLKEQQIITIKTP